MRAALLILSVVTAASAGAQPLAGDATGIEAMATLSPDSTTTDAKGDSLVVSEPVAAPSVLLAASDSIAVAPEALEARADSTGAEAPAEPTQAAADLWPHLSPDWNEDLATSPLTSEGVALVASATYAPSMEILRPAMWLGTRMAVVGLAAGVVYSVGGLISDALTTGLNTGTALAFGALIGMPVVFGTAGFTAGALGGAVAAGAKALLD